MMSLYNVIPLILCLLLSTALKAEPPKLLTLQLAIDSALQDNPNLAQMQARSKAMAAVPFQVGSLPDPVISFNALNLPVDSFNLAQDNMTQMRAGISQAIPFFGKLELRTQVASYHAEAASYDVTEQRFRLLRDVKNTWWTLFYLHRALEIVSLNQSLLRQFVDIARTKYEVGEGLQQDVLLAQLELSKLLDRKIMLQGALKKSQAQLNYLLSNPANQALFLPEKVSEELRSIKNEQSLFAEANHTRALLSSQRNSIYAAQSQLKLAEKSLMPDFNVGVFYGGRVDNLSGQERSDLMSFKVSMNVPLFAASKQQKEIDQRNSELMQQRYALQDQWNQVQADISSAHSDFQQSQQQAILFKQGIIPQAKQTVASMLAGYQVNKVDFLNLVRSQITLYNYEIQYWQAFVKVKQAAAKLISMVGKEEIYE